MNNGQYVQQRFLVSEVIMFVPDLAIYSWCLLGVSRIGRSGQRYLISIEDEARERNTSYNTTRSDVLQNCILIYSKSD